MRAGFLFFSGEQAWQSQVMDNFRNISIVGTGAVGGLYGALLQHQGNRVHFLLHRDYDHVLNHGLKVESPLGNVNLTEINAYNDPKKMPPCDLVVVALKTTSNSALRTILPAVVKDDSVVLTLQNGLGCDDEIAQIIGSENVLGGLCFLCSNKVAPGHIRHIDFGLVTLGEYQRDGQPGGNTPRLEKIVNLFRSARIPVKPIDDLHLARWKKLVWNIPFNGLSVVLNQLTDELMANHQTRALCLTLMQEVAEASAACARPIEPAFIDKMMSDTMKMKPYAPSMKLDFERGTPMELEAIYGNPIRAAKANGVAMPETMKLYRKLQSLQPNRKDCN